MKIGDFFDNLNVFFDDQEYDFADVTASIYKEKDGTITEIRFFNLSYDEFLIIDREGHATCINIDEHEEKKRVSKKRK